MSDSVGGVVSGVIKSFKGDKPVQSKPMPSLPSAPPLSERFARTRDEVAGLERALDDAVAFGQQQENRAVVAERLLEEAKRIYDEQMAEMRRELLHIRNEADRYQHDYMAMRSKFESLRSIADSVLDLYPAETAPPEVKPQLVKTPEQIDQAFKAQITAAIADLGQPRIT